MTPFSLETENRWFLPSRSYPAGLTFQEMKHVRRWRRTQLSKCFLGAFPLVDVHERGVQGVASILAVVFANYV